MSEETIDAEALLVRWQETEDPEDLDRLLRVEIDVLKSMLRGRGGHLPDAYGASDVAHEAVLGLLNVKNLPKFDSPSALRGYLWVSARRLVNLRLKDRGRAPLRLDQVSSQNLDGFLATTGGMDEALDSDRSAAIDLAMNLLSPAERDVLTLVYLDGKAISAAAEALQITKDAANMRLVRARRNLAQKLASWAEFIG